jgi:hypothetical protein
MRIIACCLLSKDRFVFITCCAIDMFGKTDTKSTSAIKILVDFIGIIIV